MKRSDPRFAKRERILLNFPVRTLVEMLIDAEDMNDVLRERLAAKESEGE